MPRRVTVPAADDLFRPTVVPDQPSAVEEEPEPVAAVPGVPPATELRTPTPSGRVKHDEKMTVYVTADELLAIEHARLELRRLHGRAVDRGRLVRAAVALALADLDEHGADSALSRRLDEG